MPTAEMELTWTWRSPDEIDLGAGTNRDRVIEHPPLHPPLESCEQRFQRLVSEWRAARGPVSTVARMAMHPSYQQIIGMGERALPLIFGELQREPDHWFWALGAITGEDPVPATARGRLNEMARAWLRWAAEHGIEWKATQRP